MATIKMKFEPWPYSELHTISPSNILVIFFVMCNPRPMPFVFSYFVDSRNPTN